MLKKNFKQIPDSELISSKQLLDPQLIQCCYFFMHFSRISLGITVSYTFSAKQGIPKLSDEVLQYLPPNLQLESVSVLKIAELFLQKRGY